MTNATPKTTFLSVACVFLFHSYSKDLYLRPCWCAVAGCCNARISNSFEQISFGKWINGNNFLLDALLTRIIQDRTEQERAQTARLSFQELIIYINCKRKHKRKFALLCFTLWTANSSCDANDNEIVTVSTQQFCNFTSKKILLLLLNLTWNSQLLTECMFGKIIK